MIALDTNLLVYASLPRDPRFAAARQALDDACRDERGCGIALFCIAEYWRAATHGRPSAALDAATFIRALVERGRVEIWTPLEGFEARLLARAVANKVIGVGIFDLQIALTVLEAGATEIWTHDEGFRTLPGLRVRNPLA